MIRAYKVKLEANEIKLEKILEIANKYRKTAKIVLKIQMKEGKFNKNYKLQIKNRKLSARYLQTLQYQIISILKSYISNRQNTKSIQLQLDSKVVKIEAKQENNTESFDYWVKVSILEKGKPVYLPITSNEYFEKIEGKLKNFCQININKFKEISISLLKDITKKEYNSKIDKIALDLGLSNLQNKQMRSSQRIGNIFLKKSKILDEIVSQFIERFNKQVYSCPAILTNPYFKNKLE